MLTALGAGVVGRWANNKKALPDPKGTVEVLFAVLFVAFLDQGRTQPIAKGFAWLFFAAVMLSDDSPLTGLAKATGNAPATTSTPPAKGTTTRRAV